MFKMKEDNMECLKIEDLLSPYQDGELYEMLKQTVENHLVSCTSCKQKLSELEFISNAIEGMGEVATEDNFTRQIMAEVSKIGIEKSKNFFPMSFVYSFIFTLFFLFGILFNPFRGGKVSLPTEKKDIITVLLQGQELLKSDRKDAIILGLQGGISEQEND